MITLAIAQPKTKTYFFRICDDEKEATMVQNSYGVFGDVIIDRAPKHSVLSWIEEKKSLARQAGYKGGKIMQL